MWNDQDSLTSLQKLVRCPSDKASLWRAAREGSDIALTKLTAALTTAQKDAVIACMCTKGESAAFNLVLHFVLDDVDLENPSNDFEDIGRAATLPGLPFDR